MNPWMHPVLTFQLENEHATQTLATLIARFAVVGDLIRLEGDLGAGKSTFAKHFIQALGHQGDVPSPTYTLVQTYETTRLPVAHIDCYRLKSPDELAELELEPYRTHGLILAEWPDKGGDMLRANQPDLLAYHMGEMNNCGVLTLHMANGPAPHSRTATLTCSRSWRRRIGFWPRINPTFAATISPTLCRESTEAGRTAFLQAHNIHPTNITSVGSDWSFRTYWRLTFANGTTQILMDAPPPLEGTTEFAQVSTWYRDIGLHAPKVVAHDHDNGYLLLEDLGNTSLASTLSPTNPQTAWYHVALDALAQSARNTPTEARHYTATDWWIEASRFTDWY
ncbi:MAG: tRNA (adenosine(37)-N6)-threonylcarbamoyltransferase complex ATPase subunit type 1 TsaE, partial [Alphaproteobacteria bacterium]